MSWITIIWSITAGICLTLAGVHLLVWVKSRDDWANLLFAIAAAGAVGCAGFELALMHAQTPVQFGEIIRWMHVPVGLMVVSLVWFVRLYLQAGRLWLAWLICGLRVVTLVLTFSLEPNLNFREITGLRQLSAWGETFVTAIGEKNPWTNITHISALLLLLFVVDAAFAAWRQGNRRRAVAIGSAFACAIAVAVVLSELLNRGILPLPFTLSIVFLIIILGVAYELSVDLASASELSRDLRKTQERMLLATEAADLGLWEWDIVRDEIWSNKVGRARLGISESECIDFNRFLQSLGPADQEATRQAIQRSLDGGEDFEVEYGRITPDGTMRWFVAQGHVEHGNEGKPSLVRGVSMDITARKQAENALRESEARLREAQNIAHMGNWELDLFTNTLTWSDEIFQIFEMDREHFGASYEAFLSAVHPEDRDKVDTAYMQSLENNEPIQYQSPASHA